MGAEQDIVVAGLDLTVDAHVHTGFAAGRDSVGVVVSAADRAGLTGVTFADQAGPDTTWLPAYADTIRRARRRTELTLRIAAEIEVVQADGWLAWPANDLHHLEALSVAVSRLPRLTGGSIGGSIGGSDGPLGAREVRALLATGALTEAQVTEIVIEATVRGIERASRYVPTQLARPLSLLAQVGIDTESADGGALTTEVLDHLADTCRATGTAVEISEAWRSPSPRIAARLREAGVPLVAASDARYAAEVGHWQYLLRV